MQPNVCMSLPMYEVQRTRGSSCAGRSSSCQTHSRTYVSCIHIAFFFAWAFALSVATEYRYVPRMATPEPAQFSRLTGFLKNMTLLTTTATRFMVLPTLNVTGETP
eukprot:GHRR01023640.1.p1 GENE.GHRR01023640.1~~GHRR01023640.1.p1  ORF type:complete len:106 (+),score=16.28 GHRR01023640.1:417-734(+)